MTLPRAHARIADQIARPQLVRLHRALSRLGAPITVMMTGAHPDDEQNALLAMLRMARGMRVVVACSTRGEGGQNALGPERRGALGLLRSLEMEASMRAIDADIHWLGHGPDDPVHDFGFSKDGDDTLARWGTDRIVERLVRAYRIERPDIVIPTFLDVPGQHGHHRAMTRAARQAIALAADPAAYPQHAAEGLAPWRVAKLYLPAWSGGGGTYDDEVPPPPATLMLRVDALEPATGVSYARIGQLSRASHASQGMGFWQTDPEAERPLHLVQGPNGSRVEADIAEDLPADLSALAAWPGLPRALAASLREVQAATAAAVATFPDAPRIIEALAAAAADLTQVLPDLPPAFAAAHGHRLRRLAADLDRALITAAGLEPVVWADPPSIAPGARAVLRVQAARALPPEVSLRIVCGPGLAAAPLPPEDQARAFTIGALPDAPLTPQFAPVWRAAGGNGPLSVEVSAPFGAHTAHARIDPEDPFRILPAGFVTLDPDAILLPYGAPARAMPIALHRSGDATARPGLDAPAGWQVEIAGAERLTVTPPPDLPPGCHRLTALLGGAPAFSAQMIRAPHLPQTPYVAPEALRILSLDLKVPQGIRVGYAGGGADGVGRWLARMGCDLTELSARDLAGDLGRFDTIVTGIFAFGLRPDLATARARLRVWVEAGGTLVTQYHRPTDGWDPDTTPPRRLRIGQPSLRWRVTDPAAPVTVLAPDHPVLRGPNAIGPADWEGWDKERGLYFASDWDPAYVPLIATHDATEAPLEGALLSARIGAGRHSHVALVLHHQMDAMVPGAFRLMANLLQTETGPDRA